MSMIILIISPILCFPSLYSSSDVTTYFPVLLYLCFQLILYKVISLLRYVLCGNILDHISSLLWQHIFSTCSFFCQSLLFFHLSFFVLIYSKYFIIIIITHLWIRWVLSGPFSTIESQYCILNYLEFPLWLEVL